MSDERHVPTNPSVHPQLGEGPHQGQDGYYEVDPRLRAAADVALTLELPLLLTGEPGCGKTDFAYVLGHALGWPVRPFQVRSPTTARDLLYSYDAVRRLADAQGDEVARQRAREPHHYLQLAALGEALTEAEPSVVLIDEIDKAPRDLPNDLLLELDRGRFQIPELSGLGTPSVAHRLQPEMGPPKGQARGPMIVITSNAEHQLPDPFLRRCVFHHVTFPKRERLERILEERCRDTPHRARLVDLFLALRRQSGLTKPPATSELIHWALALHRVFDPVEVDDWTRLLHGDLDDSRLRSRSWLELPGLSCLVKLRQDLEVLGREV